MEGGRGGRGGRGGGGLNSPNLGTVEQKKDNTNKKKEEERSGAGIASAQLLVLPRSGSHRTRILSSFLPYVSTTSHRGDNDCGHDPVARRPPARGGGSRPQRLVLERGRVAAPKCLVDRPATNRDGGCGRWRQRRSRRSRRRTFNGRRTR